MCARGVPGSARWPPTLVAVEMGWRGRGATMPSTLRSARLQQSKQEKGQDRLGILQAQESGSIKKRKVVPVYLALTMFQALGKSLAWIS